MSRLSLFKSLLALVSLTALAGCEPDADDGASSDVGPDTPGLVGQVAEERSYLWDREQWMDLTYYAGVSPLKNKLVLAQYGKAVAGIGGSRAVPGCSGALINQRLFMTAAHCNTSGDSTKTAHFGMWGNHVGAWTDSGDFARRRLAGAGYDAAAVAQLTDAQVTEFPCTETASLRDAPGGTRDVAFWTCQSQPLPIGPGGSDVVVDPGVIYGHMNLSTAITDPASVGLPPADWRPGEGLDTEVVSINNPLNSTTRRTLVSTRGEVKNSHSDCSDKDCVDWGRSCFELDNDWLAGSSGAPILLDATLEVVGVVQGNWNYGSSSQGGPIVESRFWYRNRGSVVPPVALIPQLPLSTTAYTRGSIAVTPRVGGTGGEPFSASCPADSVAVGVIGKSYTGDPASAAHVGAFGLVCAPFSVLDGGVVNPDLQPVDLMTVLAPGSEDTDMEGGVFDFNRYRNERVPRPGGASLFEEQQEATLCAPGEVLQGIQVRASAGNLSHSLINQVLEIRCRLATGSTITARPVVEPLGTLTTGSVELAECASSANTVVGIRAQAGWLLDGFSLECASAM